MFKILAMKKAFIYLFAIGLLTILGSCKEDLEIWNSSTTELDGDWYVRYDHASYGEDPFGAGYTPLFTYNTAANDGKEIWMSDEANFWDYKVRIKANPAAGTFGSAEQVTSIADGYNIKVIIENGKIIKNAVKLPSGVMADSIYFEVWFEDLEASTDIANDRLLVGGYRKTGWSVDDPH